MKKWQGENRRHQASNWVTGLQLMSLFGWVLLIVALILSFYAAPDDDYGFWRYQQLPTKDYWSSPYTVYLTVLLFATTLFSLMSIVISHFRTRRVADNKYYNFTLLFLVCIAWLSYILFNTMY